MSRHSSSPAGKATKRPDEASARRAALEIEADATPWNTLRSEESAMRYWSEWYRLRYQKRQLPLPVPEKIIVQFILDHAVRRAQDGSLRSEMHPDVERELVARKAKRPGPFKASTITQRVSMIGRINQPHLQGALNPAGTQRVRALLKNLRTSYARNELEVRMPDGERWARVKDTGTKSLAPEELSALTGEGINKVLDILDRDIETATSVWHYRRAVRDRAILLFAFMSGGRRRSEVARAQMKRLEARPNGEFRYVIGATKTTRGDEPRRSREKPISGVAAAALSDWLTVGEVRSGAIFRRISRGGKIMASAITPETVRNIVKRLTDRAKLKGTFSAHSIRSGFVTEAGIQGKNLFETMRLSGHKSVQSANRYYRERDVMDSPAARLIDRPIRRVRKGQ